MEVRSKIQNFLQRIRQFPRLKLFIFSFFGLVVLILILEGFYYVYSKNFYSKGELKELPDGSKQSTILGEELAISPLEDYQDCGGNELCNLDVSIGVRELADGAIGIGGYFVSASANGLTLKAKDKEIKVAVDAETAWEQIDARSLKEEGLKRDKISPGDLNEGDRLDVICRKTESGLRAIGVSVIYR